MIPNREQAYEILTRYNKSEALIKHALAVEGVLRHFAVKSGEDPERWGAVGLLHDLDYELYPEQHCHKSMELLRELRIDEWFIRAVASHGYGLIPGLPEPQSALEKTLYTIDELTGLINACAIMRPSRSVMDLELKSVKKKWKQSSFAAGVSREVIENGARLLGMSLDEVICETIFGMRECAEAIGLKGEL